MPGGRDPYSELLDPFVAKVLGRAIRSKTAPRISEAFLASPIREFRDLDYGGRTAHERGFIRAVYYQVIRVPVHHGVPQKWSAKITWGPVERRGGRWGRPVRVRLFKYGSAQRYVEDIMRRDPWSEDAGGGSWSDGTRRSHLGDRIDQNRRDRAAR